MQVFLSPAKFELNGITTHKHGLGCEVQFKNGGIQSRTIGFSEDEAETFLSGKIQCLLGWGGDKRNELLFRIFDAKSEG